jgi:hypothetical protein
VKRAYDATHKTAATPAANGETRVEQAGARDRAAGEVEAWRKKAEADGGLFDLKKDSVKVIATTIAGNVSLHRLTALQKALGDEIKASRLRQSRLAERRALAPGLTGGAPLLHANSECGGSYVVASAQITSDAKWLSY